LLHEHGLIADRDLPAHGREANAPDDEAALLERAERRLEKTCIGGNRCINCIRAHIVLRLSRSLEQFSSTTRRTQDSVAAWNT
jgi:hypothetical protein